MKNIVLAAIAAITVCAVAPAFAADIPVRKAAPMAVAAPAPTWTGCYIGAGVGYGISNLDHRTSSNTTGQVFDTGHANSGKGYLGTVGVGCDFQVATSWVIGAFADFDWNSRKAQYSFNCPAGCAGPTGYIGSMKQNWTWAVGARAGYLVTPQLLTYWDAGYTRTRFDQVNYLDAALGSATGLVLPAQNAGGWFIGGGTEYALGFWPGLFWKSEYRFADYGSRSVAQLCTAAACGGAGTTHSIDTGHQYVQTVRSELVWRFSSR